MTPYMHFSALVILSSWSLCPGHPRLFTKNLSHLTLPLPSVPACPATTHPHFLPISVDELFPQSDIISLYLPLSPSTRHIIGTNEFEKTKDGVVIVNTVRDPLIDEAALVAALESGKVFSQLVLMSLKRCQRSILDW